MLQRIERKGNGTRLFRTEGVIFGLRRRSKCNSKMMYPFIQSTPSFKQQTSSAWEINNGQELTEKDDKNSLFSKKNLHWRWPTVWRQLGHHFYSKQREKERNLHNLITNRVTALNPNSAPVLFTFPTRRVYVYPRSCSRVLKHKFDLFKFS